MGIPPSKPLPRPRGHSLSAKIFDTLKQISKVHQKLQKGSKSKNWHPRLHEAIQNPTKLHPFFAKKPGSFATCHLTQASEVAIPLPGSWSVGMPGRYQECWPAYHSCCVSSVVFAWRLWGKLQIDDGEWLCVRVWWLGRLYRVWPGMIEVYRYVGLLRRKFQLFLEGGPFKQDLDLRQCERQHLQDSTPWNARHFMSQGNTRPWHFLASRGCFNRHFPLVLGGGASWSWVKQKHLSQQVFWPLFLTPHRKVTRITPLLQAPKDTEDEAPPTKTDAGTGGGYAGASSQVWPLDSPRLARGINKRGKSDTPFLSESLSNFSRWVWGKKIKPARIGWKMIYIYLFHPLLIVLKTFVLFGLEPFHSQHMFWVARSPSRQRRHTDEFIHMT